MRQIAFFDFDGTITYKDSLLEIAKYQKGKIAWLIGMLVLLPRLIAMKLKLIPNAVMKEHYLTYFFGGISVNRFQEMCAEFQKACFTKLIRPAAITEIRRHQQNGTPVVLVSASPENWLKGWCRENNITCIATRLQVENGSITGKIDGKNCYGPEKVNRIKELYKLDTYDQIFCYGDSGGDREMLQIATEAHYKPFRKLLK